MILTAENTAIVLDSTADFPEGPERFPNWRIVPLYVNVGGESYRDYVDLTPDELYRRLKEGESATTSQPTPGDFLAVYQELEPQFERIYSLQLSSTLSGTFASATAAAASVPAVRVVDTRTVCAAVAMLALAVQRRLERGTTDEEIDALVERYLTTHGLLFTVETLDYLARGGRIGRGAAFAGRARRSRSSASFWPRPPRTSSRCESGWAMRRRPTRCSCSSRSCGAYDRRL